MKLVSTDAFLAGTKQVECKQPLAQRDMAIREDRPNRDRKLLAASGAFPYTLADVSVLFGRFRLQPIGIIHFPAVRTNWAIRPTELFNELSSLVLIAKVLSQID